MRAAMGCWLLMLVFTWSAGTWAQIKNENRVLTVNGQSGEVAVVQFDNRDYIDLQALVRIANGTIGFRGDQIVLTLPGAPLNSSAPEPMPPEHRAESSFSQEFMKAGIEVIALLREWASPLAYAIQNGYPITEQWVAGYREQAAHGLRLCTVAATTGADRNALQLLNNEFEAVKDWSNKLVEARKSMDTAKYALSENALRNDPLSQKILACAHFLGPMLGSGAFQDDASCH